uniref:lysozyme n=1 Tax=Strongyloides venezuelensis TaxID=75913 RepID=A0A0K0EW41_STRVS
MVKFQDSDKCLEAIAKQESGGNKNIGCVMDKGSLSCGQFQIKLPYYKDAGEPGRQPGQPVEDAWKQCANDYSCAATSVKNYFDRYQNKCPDVPPCEAMARLHNGGPNGCNKSATDVYWNGVKDKL